MKPQKAIGLMSGSSLDGLDIAYVEFGKEYGEWQYNLLIGETLAYSDEWQNILNKIRNYDDDELQKLHIRYGNYLGKQINRFIKKHSIKPEIVASHGHTVFHNPAKGYTFQLGSGQVIAETTNLLTVSDFRSKDISLGGQGAPLVPIGDELLFGDYIACINLGGIANISFKKKGERVAYDVCPANQLLNYLAKKVGLKFDEGGRLASEGQIINELYENLSNDKFYYQPFPKSISNEYIAEKFIPIIDNSKGKIENKLYTTTLHIVDEIYKAITFVDVPDELFRAPTMHRNLRRPAGEILITGGGAKNKFLINELKKITPYNLVIPEPELIDFKEALIFAFMGVLKVNGEINCLSSATGASKDSSSGTIFQVKPHSLK